MFKWLLPRTLLQKLLFYIGGIACVVLILTRFDSWLIIRTVLQKELNFSIQQEIKATATEINDICQKLAMVPYAIQAWQEPRGPTSDPAIAPFFVALLENPLMRSLYGIYIEFENMPWNDPRASFWIDKQSWPNFKHDTSDYHTQDWYTEPKQKKKLLFTEPYFDELGSKIDMISCVIPLFDSNGDFFAVAGIDIALETLQRLVKTTIDKIYLENEVRQTLKDATTYLISQKGELISDSRTAHIPFCNRKDDSTASCLNLASKNIPNGEVLLKTENGLLRYNQDKVSRLLCWQEVPLTGWKLAFDIPESAIMQPVVTLIRHLLVTAILGLCIMIAVVFVTARRFTRPIDRLIEATAAIEQETYTPKVLEPVSKDSDELGELARVFLKMALEIQSRELRLKDWTCKLEETVKSRTLQLSKAVQEAKAARAIAEEANKAKSVFLSKMSHELRTPMNAIIGYSELLMEEAEENHFDQMVTDLKKIHGAGKHLLTLINDILDLSKIEAGEMQLSLNTFELHPLLEEVVATVKPLVERNHNTFEVQIAPDLGTMTSDLIKVKQILLNLLSNASKFTDKGIISLIATRKEESLYFEVRDTGIGMSAEQLEKIFQAFSQIDSSILRRHEGSGLGLLLSRQFARLMGGDISVQSTPRKGSTFTVRLPIISDKKNREWTLPAKSAPPPSTLPTVLVIDDDILMLDLMIRFLEKEGFHVQTAQNGKRGLELAKTHRPDLITLDIVMPEMGGWQVLEQLKADPSLATIPVIVLSIKEEKEKAEQMGAAEYLTKPINWQQLLETIHKIREKK